MDGESVDPHLPHGHVSYGSLVLPSNSSELMQHLLESLPCAPGLDDGIVLDNQSSAAIYLSALPRIDCLAYHSACLYSLVSNSRTFSSDTLSNAFGSGSFASSHWSVRKPPNKVP